MAKQRFDSVKIKAHFDEHGFLVDRPIVARIGAQTYKTPFGDRVEFRPASEVFDPESLASYAGKPVTVGHVTVTPDNAEKVVVGSCAGGGIPSGIGVEVPVSVYSERAINKAKRKEAAELSVGYTSEDIEKPGWGSNETGEYIFEDDLKEDEQPPEGWVRFDALQTKIRVNHVAMVFKGRAGIAKLNLDSEQEFPYHDTVISNNEVKVMKKIKIDSVEMEVDEAVASHIEKLYAEVKEVKEKADAIEAERDVLKAKVDAIPEEIEKAVEKHKADAAELSKLVATASEAGVKCDGLDAKGIKVAFLKAITGKDVSDKSDAYIDNAYDFAKDCDNMSEQRKTIKGDSFEKEDEQEVAPKSRIQKQLKNK